MYEDKYADPKHGIRHGTYHRMTPYYRVLNNLVRQTLTPKVRDHSSILSSTKMVMFAMQPRVEPFRVFEFLWHEIIHNSFTTKSGLQYAPYIIRMILTVTG